MIYIVSETYIIYMAWIHGVAMGYVTYFFEVFLHPSKYFGSMPRPNPLI